MGISLYVHIPFCTAKCGYCDFTSFPVEPDDPVLGGYLQSLCREVELVRDRFGRQVLDTVYFGGGTPSILCSEQLDAVFSRLRSVFSVNPEAEITLEANPETLTQDKLDQFRQIGINRLSIGAQTSVSPLLERMGRKHGWDDVVRVAGQARHCGFTNLNVDLIYGLPGQDRCAWSKTLNDVLKLAPEHLSLYGLKLSSASRWGALNRQGQLVLPDEDVQADMYQEAISTLTSAGYEHYEISNFARPDRRARHNLTYWYNREYLGLGVAASSHYQSSRWTNTDSVHCYCRTITEGSLPREEVTKLSRKDKMTETMIMGLRLLEGISVNDFERRFGCSPDAAYEGAVSRLVSRGLLQRQGGRLALTKRAVPIANEVFIEFI